VVDGDGLFGSGRPRLGLQFPPGRIERPAGTGDGERHDDSSDVLDENPDLYLWLGGTDLAME